MGPFVDYQNEDIQEGVISYKNSTGELEFIDYETLFKKIQQYIQGELAHNQIKTKVVIVPSSREIQQLYPMP